MKKLIPLMMLLFVVSACSDCKDEYCPTGYVCNDGVCEKSDGTCPIGYEGEDCATEANQKFAGNYNVDYTGGGGLSNSNGTTVANVSTVSGSPHKIRIDVDLALEGNVFGQAIPLDLSVSIVGDVDGDTYYVPNTTIETEVDVQGFPLPVELTFEVEGTKLSDSQLNSTLTMSGIIAGTVNMTGVK